MLVVDRSRHAVIVEIYGIITDTRRTVKKMEFVESPRFAVMDNRVIGMFVPWTGRIEFVGVLCEKANLVVVFAFVIVAAPTDVHAPFAVGSLFGFENGCIRDVLATPHRKFRAISQNGIRTQAFHKRRTGIVGALHIVDIPLTGAFKTENYGIVT